jgi:hypothetical protein
MDRIAAWNRDGLLLQESAPRAAFGRLRLRCAPVTVRFLVLMVCGLSLSGCLTQGNCLPTTCGGPERLIPIEQDLGPIADSTGYADVLSRYDNTTSLDTMAGIRNNFIFERIYAMDVKYTAYEEALTKESESEGFWAAVTNAALTGTGALLPVAQTTRLLSGIAAGLTTVDQAYNKQFLYSKTVQILESQMRAKRATVVSLIVVRAKTPVTQYPLGMAMSDLEEYYRAGTLASAFVDLSENVGNNATQNKIVKDALKGGGDIVARAQARAANGTTGIVTSGTIVADVTKPLPEFPKSPRTNPGGSNPILNPAEKSLRVSALQLACEPLKKATGILGDRGSETRLKLSAYLNAIRPSRLMRTSPPLDVFDQKDGDDLNALIDENKSCNVPAHT